MKVEQTNEFYRMIVDKTKDDIDQAITFLIEEDIKMAQKIHEEG